MPAPARWPTCFVIGMTLIAGSYQTDLKIVMNQGAHPFLLVRATDYPSLQERASRSPWKEMKAQAIAAANALVYDTRLDYVGRSARMQNIVGSAALAYILDPLNRPTYKHKIYASLLFWDDLYDELYGWNWTNYTRPASAFFVSVLALDIIYNDLTDTERATIEAKLDRVSEWYRTTTETHYWQPTPHAVQGIWALYRNDRSRIDAIKSGYRTEFRNFFTPSGVFYEGPGYAVARLSGTDRVQKWAFMDVLEFTGEDNTYYSDPLIRLGYEWMYRAAPTPTHRINVFADSVENRVNVALSPAVLRSYRFSPQAAANAAWWSEGAPINEYLLSYLLADRPLSASVKPLSNVWTDNAAFWENHPSDKSLMGTLWNPTREGDHSHRDVNAIHLTAYGEALLSNTGWALNGAFGSPAPYFKENAEASNVLLIGGVNHVGKVGAGIREGFTAPLLDYASGDAGGALGNGTHVRNFIFVHPQEGKNGYFVLFDEAVRSASGTATTADVVLHPPSTTYRTVSANREYQWKVRRLGTGDVVLSIFLGTPPKTVAIRDGPLSLSPGGIFKYLFSAYPLDVAGRKHIVTVLFPHDGNHVKARMKRVSGAGYTGASVDLGGRVLDVALESAGTRTITRGRVSFRGLATLYRQGGTPFYFVRKGRSFNDGLRSRRGFKSGADVSIYLKVMSGKIVSPGTDVTFYHPGITGVRLAGNSVPKLASGSGWVRVIVPDGTHEIQFTP